MTASADPVAPLAVVALGGNLGDVRSCFRQAQADLLNLALDGVRFSGVYRSAPWQSEGPDYWNAVAVFRTALKAPALLEALLAIEARAGRERPYHYAPRTLDLDLIAYGSAQINSPHLTVPHPRWPLRAFVVEPLAELLPERVSPAMRQAVQDESLRRVSDWAQWLARDNPVD
jgi:2-amino-4-hydroxy-6-hydroxymethyldihydropteridine diphosphokinase